MLEYLSKRWFFLLILLGLLLAATQPEQTKQCVDLVETKHVAALTLFLMAFGLETRRLWSSVRRPWPAFLALGISYGLAPVLAFLGGYLLPGEEDFRIGLVIAGCVPCTLASATIWTRMAGGNEAVSLLVTMLSNILVFVFTAGWLTLLTGEQVEFGLGLMVWQLLLVVVLPIVAAQSIRNLGPMGRLADRTKKIIGVVCRLLILIIIVKSAVKASAKFDELGLVQLVWIGLVCVSVHLVLLMVGFQVGRRLFSRPDAIAVALAGSQKTLPVGAWLILEYYGSFELAIVPMLFYHVGQLVVDTYIAESFFHRRPADRSDDISEP